MAEAKEELRQVNELLDRLEVEMAEMKAKERTLREEFKEKSARHPKYWFMTFEEFLSQE